MWRNQIWLGFFYIVIFAGWWHGISFAGQTVDNEIYGRLLKETVSNGIVDYNGLKVRETELDAYLDLLSRVDPVTLSNDEQFAFYANAYNAWTIKLILTRYPNVTSIKDLGSLLKSPWKKKISLINGTLLTLDQIEHDILRPRFKDPRVHFAINCAAKSCPPLSSIPFSGLELNQQLDRLTRAFINDSKSNYLKGNTLYVSSIFKWFKEDFKDGIIPFFIMYAQKGLKSALKAVKDEVKIKYLPYDWSLNGK